MQDKYLLYHHGFVPEYTYSIFDDDDDDDDLGFRAHPTARSYGAQPIRYSKHYYSVIYQPPFDES